MKDIKFKRSKADPCLYFKWSAKYGLILIISWVDDLLICGRKQACMEVKEAIMQHFEIDDVGEMKEYVGCKVERRDGTIKLTQPVLLQSFIDEFDLPNEQDEPKTPAMTGEVLPVIPEDAPTLSEELQFTYRS